MDAPEAGILAEFSRLLRSEHNPKNDCGFANCCAELQEIVDQKRLEPHYLVRTDAAAITLGLGVMIRTMSQNAQQDIPQKDAHLDSRREVDCPRKESSNYTIVVQNLDDIRDVENAPWVSMPVYLEHVGELERLRRISIYQSRGDTFEAIRFLFMNAEALELWRRMGHSVTISGTRHRPPQLASIAFGVPFSE